MSTPVDDRTRELGPEPPPILPPLPPRGAEPFDRGPLGRRMRIMVLIAIGVVAILVLRLWTLQVLDVQTYRQQAVNNGLRSIDVPAPRGQILDAQGKVLVGTRPANAVAIDPARFPGLLAACARGVAGPEDERSADERARRIAEAVQRANALPAARQRARIAQIRRQIEGRDEVRAWRGCADGFDEIARLSAVIGVPVASIEDALHQAALRAPFDSVVVAPDVDRSTLFYLKERADSFPGVRIVEGTARDYRTFRATDGERYVLAPHLWGELSEVSPEQLEDSVTYLGAEPGDQVGQRGVERAFDRYLRGTNGSLARRVNAFGDPVGRVVRSQAAKPGDNVKLTIDAGIQSAAETALRDAIAYARANDHPKADSGAIIAMDPRTGAIRAIASYPAFDPAILASGKGQEYWNRLASRTGASPLLDRALTGLYPAGSTFKPVTAIAAQAAGRNEPNGTIDCPPEMTIDGQTYRNFETELSEPMDLVKALSVSCNTYFYELGRRMYEATPKDGSFEPQPLWARRLGFGAPTGIDIGGDAAGSVPDAAYKRRRFGDDRVHNRWTSGDSVLQAIGQGDLEVTPLQIARLYALIANGGTLVQPHVGAAVIGRDGTERERLEPDPGTRVQIDPYVLAAIRKGLEGVVADPDGTAYDAFAGFPIPVAGKTGTAEKKGKRDFAWFAGYAPANDPKLVVVCIVEQGGFGADTAAPAVRQVMAKALGVDEATIAQIQQAEEAGVYLGPDRTTDPAAAIAEEEQ